jgi:hypothetical protein
LPHARCEVWIGIQGRDTDVVFLSEKSTDFGTFGGFLKDLTATDIGVFTPQYKSVDKELGLDSGKTNVDGGAIALTYPMAASGARTTIHLLHELCRRGARFGLGVACIGGGPGGAVVVEAFPA